jgi:hypothetical protein
MYYPWELYLIFLSNGAGLVWDMFSRFLVRTVYCAKGKVVRQGREGEGT